MTLLTTLISIVAFVALVVVFVRMRTRRFYFVRHGETTLNAAHIKQGAEGGLSESGKQQAAAVGEALAPLPIHTIIASPYERAEETAIIINDRLHASITYSPLLVERRNPSFIIGKHREEPEVARIVDEMDLAYHADDYRFSDEENFIELKERARACLDFLEHHRARETAVITHHVFLKMLVAYLLYRERLHATDFVKLSFFNVSDNAGITVCEFHPWKRFSATHGWEVVSYNEQPGA